jgi:lysophospholipase L1-like esterase
LDPERRRVREQGRAETSTRRARAAVRRAAGVGLVVVLACGRSAADERTERSAAAASPAVARLPAPAGSSAVVSSSADPGGPTLAPGAIALASSARAEPGCPAPSLALDGDIDAHDDGALTRCVRLERPRGHCGRSGAVDVERFDESVLPIDASTEARIVAVATKGKALGRNPRAFGLVGDSITVSGDFLHAWSARSRAERVIDPRLLPLLTLADGRTIADYYRGAEVETFAGRPIDSFDAERAAKIGARASYATSFGAASPVAALVEHVQPAVAIVAFGANDAAYRPGTTTDLADEFEKNLLAVVAALEERGVVVILENEMRHGDQPGVADCPVQDHQANDWRTAIMTTAIVRRTAEIACREHLPFVDLRYAMDGASAHGLGPDGVHPSSFRKGGGHLDASGLDCGYNIRNLVTLAALRNVVEVLERRGIF